VRPIERERTDSRLIVIDHENETLGEVVAVGPGKRTKRGVQALDVSVGDVVRFGCDYLNFPKYREGATEYVVLQEADIAGIVDAIA
jgi:co-chaperonin GroES (HSP10)